MFSLSRQGASTAVQTLQYRDRVYRGDKTRCLKIFSAPNYSGLFCNFLLFTVSYRFSKRNNFEAHFWWVTFPMGPERKQFSPVFLLTKTEKICPCFLSEILYDYCVLRMLLERKIHKLFFVEKLGVPDMSEATRLCHLPTLVI